MAGAAATQVTHQLDEEEGMAIGAGMQVRRQLRMARALGDLDQARGVCHAEVAQMQRAQRAIALEAREEIEEGMRAVERLRPVGRQHQNWRGHQGSRHDLEQLERVAIRPVQIVEEQHCRFASGDRAQMGSDGAHQLVRRLRWRSRAEGRWQGRRRRHRQRAEQLVPGREDRGSAPLVAAADGDDRAPRLRHPGQIVRQRRLANARLPGEQHATPVTAHGRGELLAQGGALPLPADNRGRLERTTGAVERRISGDDAVHLVPR